MPADDVGKNGNWSPLTVYPRPGESYFRLQPIARKVIPDHSVSGDKVALKLPYGRKLEMSWFSS